MLDPHRGTGFPEKLLHLHTRGAGHRRVKIEGWNAIEGSLLGQVVEVTLEQQIAEMFQPQEQHLVTGRVAGRGFDDNAAVAEYVVVLVPQRDALRVLQFLV